MRRRLVASLLCGFVALAPASAAAQEQPPDRLPTDQQMVAPEDAPESVGACGSESTTFVDGGPAAMTQPDTDTAKDVIGEGGLNLMSVRGTIVHAEGNLMLVRTPVTPSLGNTAPAARPDAAFAVVRLPAQCQPGMLSEGTGVLAIGTPSADGILNAESVQPTQ